jgi:hypothetical protein
MSRRVVLAIAIGAVVALLIPVAAFPQAAGPDPDSCPGVVGTASGCPDGDSDGIADRVDGCPTNSSRKGPDRDADGCAEPITALNFTVRYTRRGVRFTGLSLTVLAGGRIGYRWLCSGGVCLGARTRPGRIKFKVSRRSVRPGGLLKIATRNIDLRNGFTECHTIRVRRGRHIPKATTRRTKTGRPIHC